MSEIITRRLKPTVTEATDELRETIVREKRMRIFHLCASWLQVLVAAAITALSSGAKLKGIDTSTAILVLGAVSTVIASVLAYLKGLNEPYASRLRALALHHLLREIKNFIIDSESTMPNLGIQDSKIEGFRLSLDRILQPAGRGRNLSSPSSVDDPEKMISLEGDTSEGRV